MKKLLILLMILTAHVGYAGNISTWLGTGLNPITTSEYPERDDLTKWMTVATIPWFVADPTYPNYGYNCLVYDDKLWIIGAGEKHYLYDGRRNIFCTRDGVSWETVATNPSFGDQGLAGDSCVFDEKMWVVGCYHYPYYSPDGIHWSVATSTYPAGFNDYSISCCSHEGKMWIHFGTSVYCSSDGINWIAKTTSATSGGRIRSLLGKLMLFTDGIYSSDDGITWTKISATDGIYCYGSNPIEYNGKMVLVYTPQVIGWPTNATVRHSTDGSVFSVATTTAQLAGWNNQASSVVFKGHVWSIGGVTHNQQWRTRSPLIRRSY